MFDRPMDTHRLRNAVRRSRAVLAQIVRRDSSEEEPPHAEKFNFPDRPTRWRSVLYGKVGHLSTGTALENRLPTNDRITGTVVHRQ